MAQWLVSRSGRVVLMTVLVLATAAAFAFAAWKQSQASSHALVGATVAFIGDSYTAGTGAESPSRGFASLVSATEGWRSTNVARGGTGYTTSLTGASAEQACGSMSCPNYIEVVEAVAKVDPRVVIVSGGRNDALVATGSERMEIRRFFDELRRRLPHATLIAVSPVWDSSAPPASLTAMAKVIQQSVDAVDGHYLDIGQPLRGRPDLLSGDGIHPNDAGHARIAIAIQRALEQASIA